METLKKLRKHAGYTQKQVAEKLGISQNNYSYWEQGKVKVSRFYLEKLAKIFNVSIYYFLGIDEKVEREPKKNDYEIIIEKIIKITLKTCCELLSELQKGE